MNKGIVMELTPKHYIVMTEDGQFLKLPRRHQSSQIGEEIHFSAPPFRWKKTHVSVVSGLVAAMFLAVFVFSGLGNFMGAEKRFIVAYITVDINPSAEFGIDSNENVIEAKGLNDEGKDVLQFIDYKGKSLEAVSAEFIKQADQHKYLDKYLQEMMGSIVITSTIIDESDPMDENIVTDKVKQSMKQVLKESHPIETKEFLVETIPAPKELRDEAASKGISTGKLAVKLLSKEQGNTIPLETLENISIHEAVKQFGGVGELMKGNKGGTKDLLKHLLEQEQKNSKPKKDDKDKRDKKNNNNNDEENRIPANLDNNRDHGKDRDRENKDGSKENDKDKGRQNVKEETNQNNNKNDDMDKDRDRDVDKDKEEKNKNNDKDREEDSDREQEQKMRDRDKDRNSDIEDKDRERATHNDRDKDKDKDNDRDKDRDNEKDKNNERNSENDRHNDRTKDKQRDNNELPFESWRQ